MFCKHCGKQIADDSKFCSECGQSVLSKSSFVTDEYEKSHVNSRVYCTKCGSDNMTEVIDGDTAKYLCFSCGNSMETPKPVKKEIKRPTYCMHCGKKIAEEGGFCHYCGNSISNRKIIKNSRPARENGSGGVCCPNCGSRELTNISSEGASEYLCFSCGASFETPDSMRNRATRKRSEFAFKCAVVLVVLFIVAAAALVIVYNKYGDRLEYSDDAQEAVLVTWVIISVAGICTAISLVVSYVEKNRESHELIKDAAAFDGLQYDFDRSGEAESQQICCPHCGDTHFAMGNHDEIADIYSFRCKNCLCQFMPPNQCRDGFIAYRALYRAKMFWVWCLGILDAVLLFPIIIDILTIFDSGGGASSSSHRSYLLTLFIMFVPITVAFIMCLVKAVKYNNNANYLYSNADAIELRICAKKYPDAERVETLEQD